MIDIKVQISFINFSMNLNTSDMNRKLPISVKFFRKRIQPGHSCFHLVHSINGHTQKEERVLHKQAFFMCVVFSFFALFFIVSIEFFFYFFPSEPVCFFALSVFQRDAGIAFCKRVSFWKFQLGKVFLKNVIESTPFK